MIVFFRIAFLRSTSSRPIAWLDVDKSRSKADQKIVNEVSGTVEAKGPYHKRLVSVTPSNGQWLLYLLTDYKWIKVDTRPTADEAMSAFEKLITGDRS